jgi:hypothetical protein
MMSSVVNKLAEVGTHSEFIVPGYTSKLQVLDVGINRPFKVYIANEYNEHMVRANTKPTRQNVAQWIKTSWDTVSIDTIFNTWRHIGIKS